ncbi:MAG: hypothetical protein GY756_19460 [bacterium]|nr:hypothetical protein [bacterium]
MIFNLNKKTYLKKIFILLLLFSPLLLNAEKINITNKELNTIGNKIFYNECAGKDSNLTHWNKGEYFASLGIGHFIWYTAYKKGPFDESFPQFLSFLKKNKIDMPEWLQPNHHCPWQNRKDFYKNYNSSKMVYLRNFLKNSKALQIKFIADRLVAALPKMLNEAQPKQRRNIYKQFNRMLKSQMGLYPLIDYVNFKGEGVLKTERHKNQGWGLLQVLEHMRGTKAGPSALKEFAKSADYVLTRRVKNSPNKKYEEKWLIGWRNRINTYYQ